MGGDMFLPWQVKAILVIQLVSWLSCGGGGCRVPILQACQCLLHVPPTFSRFRWWYRRGASSKRGERQCSCIPGDQDGWHDLSEVKETWTWLELCIYFLFTLKCFDFNIDINVNILQLKINIYIYIYKQINIHAYNAYMHIIFFQVLEV